MVSLMTELTPYTPFYPIEPGADPAPLYHEEVKNGIVFYVSADGLTVGMDARGVAKLLSIPTGRLYPLLDTYEGGGELPSKTLNYLRERNFSMPIVEMVEEYSLKLIPYELCSALVFYFAFEALGHTEDVRRNAQKGYHLFLSPSEKFSSLPPAR